MDNLQIRISQDDYSFSRNPSQDRDVTLASPVFDEEVGGYLDIELTIVCVTDL